MRLLERSNRLDKARNDINSEDKQLAAKAAYYLATHYRYGWGVTKDMARALKYYHKAVNLGYPEACYEVSRLFLQGNSLEYISQDIEKAKYCAEKCINCSTFDTDNTQKQFKEQCSGLLQVINYKTLKRLVTEVSTEFKASSYSADKLAGIILALAVFAVTVNRQPHNKENKKENENDDTAPQTTPPPNLGNN